MLNIKYKSVLLLIWIFSHMEKSWKTRILITINWLPKINKQYFSIYVSVCVFIFTPTDVCIYFYGFFAKSFEYKLQTSWDFTLQYFSILMCP